VADTDPVGLFSPEELEIEDSADAPEPARQRAQPRIPLPRPVAAVADVRIYVAEQLGHALRLHHGLKGSVSYLDHGSLEPEQVAAIEQAGRGALDAARNLYLTLARLTNALGLPDHGDPL
jgi:hypothetical protein